MLCDLQISLLDFGATRAYSRRFTDDYIRVIMAASVGDRQAVLEGSQKLGFLTGYESKVRAILKWLVLLNLFCGISVKVM